MSDNNGIMFHDNRRVQTRKWGAEFLAITLCIPNDDYRPYTCALTRYCCPGRIDSYCFDWVPPSSGVGDRVRYFTDTGESLLKSVQSVQADLDKPQVVEMLVEMCHKPGLQRPAREFAENLLATLAPKSKSLRAIRKNLNAIRDKRRVEIEAARKATV